MRPGSSGRFFTGLVIIEESDVQLELAHVIREAHRCEAVRTDPDSGKELYIVRFPDDVDGSYTESGLSSAVSWHNKQTRLSGSAR